MQYVQDMLLNDTSWNFWDYNYTIVELADKIQPGNATAYDYDSRRSTPAAASSFSTTVYPTL